MIQPKERIPQWVVGDPEQSAMFHQARSCAARAGSAKHGAILWAGNALLFLGATLLSTPDGNLLVSFMASAELLNTGSFGLITSLLLGYASARAVHLGVIQREARKEMGVALSGISASVLDISPRVKLLEGPSPMPPTQEVILALDFRELAKARKELKTALEAMRREDAPTHNRGPK